MSVAFSLGVLSIGAGLWVWTIRRLMGLRHRELDIQAAALACSTSEFTALRERVRTLEAIADGVH
ncbi:hypothetical protein ABU113_02045 [Sphingosinicellaceae bacterium M-36]